MRTIMNSKLFPLAFLAAGAIIGSALNTPALAQHHDSSAPPSKSATKDTPSMMMHKSMAKMSKNMATMKMTGEVDKDFAIMMAEHHLGAIQMAEIELKYGKNAALKAMAKEMIAMQKKERTALLKHAKMKH